MSKLNYDSNGRYTANSSIDAFILGSQAADYRHVFISDDAVPYCDKTNKRICSPVMPTLIDERADRMVRAKNEHEAGHGRLTPSNMNPEWSNTKCSLVNVLEDLRIERGVGTLSEAFKGDLQFLNRELIGKINARMMAGEMQPKPIDEAMMALQFEADGCSVQWQMSPTAQVLYSVAKPDFDRWTDANFTDESGFAKIVEIADTIIANWEKLMENAQGEEGDGEGSEQQDGDGDGVPNDGESSSSSEKQGKSGNSKGGQKSKKSEKQDGGAQGEGEKAEQNKKDGGAQGNGGQKSENAEQGGKSEKQDGEGKQGNAKQGDDEGEATAPSKVGKDNDADAAGDAVDHGNGKRKADLDSMTDGNNAMEQEIKKEFEQFKSDAQSIFGGYTAYTAEDEIIRAQQNQCRFEIAYNAIHGKIAGLSSHLEQTLRSKARCTEKGNRERGKLDVKRIASIAKSMTDRPFSQKVQGMSVKNTAVTILIDESGSIGYNCQEFQKLCIAFSEVFDRLGVKFEILGHTTGSSALAQQDEELRKVFTRYRKIRIFEHKNFDENYRSEKYRIGSIGSFNCNVDGDVLLTAFRRINEQRAERRIVFVLSDGQPNASQKGGNEVFFKHLKQVADFCRGNGTEVYAFGIGTHDPERFYGEKNFVYIPNTDEIGGQFFRTLSNILIDGGMKQGR